MSQDTTSPRAPALDPEQVAEVPSTNYPEPHRQKVRGRHRRRLGEALGLTQFGVNITRLEPGTWSSQRHWHAREDEFILILEGTPTLITDAGEQILQPGHVAGFPAGRADGHHLVNRSDRPVLYLEVGSRIADDRAFYSDIDMISERNGLYTRRDGTPY